MSNAATNICPFAGFCEIYQQALQSTVGNAERRGGTGVIEEICMTHEREQQKCYLRFSMPARILQKGKLFFIQILQERAPLRGFERVGKISVPMLRLGEIGERIAKFEGDIDEFKRLLEEFDLQLTR